MLKIHQIYISMPFTSVLANIILLHILVLKQRFYNQGACIEGIIMQTLITRMGELTIILCIAAHQVLLSHQFNCFLLSINKQKIWHWVKTFFYSCLQKNGPCQLALSCSNLQEASTFVIRAEGKF